MVWSEQEGVSIVLPSDRVDGDGRNYIVIGEEVPADIADAFTACLVFRNGHYSEADEPYGSNGVQAKTHFQYPNGFVYYAVGITTSGSFEIVAFYYTVSSPTGGVYQTFRQTVLSINTPSGVDNSPVLALGSNAGRGSYNEGSVNVVFGNDAPIQPTYGVGFAAYVDATAQLNGIQAWKRSNVVTIAGAYRTTASVANQAVIATLPPNLAPPMTIPTETSDPNTTVLIQPNGHIVIAAAHVAGYIASFSCTYGL